MRYHWVKLNKCICSKHSGGAMVLGKLPHVCFILDLILIPMFLRLITYELGIFHAIQTTTQKEKTD